MKNSFDSFAIWAPFQVLEKATTEQSKESESMVGRIGGIISSETEDQQDEILIQKAVDWDYFMSKGWFNYEHGTGPENVLGHPESVTQTTYKGKPATRVEGVLYLHKARAREIFETAKAMQKAGGNRNLGFSVEGQVLERDGGDRRKITKSRVLNVAITAHPVHPDARLEVLARAFGAGATAGYQNPAGMGGSISPLITQSLEGIPAIATFGVAAQRKGKMTIEELALLLNTTFPALSFSASMNVATEIVRVLG